MTKRTPKSQTQHDHIVQVVVNHLKQEGHRDIRADLRGYTQPVLVRGTKQNHIPDVTSNDVIVEVETGDTIDSDHTVSQWSLFSDHAANHGQTFWVVVPKGFETAAQRQLNALDLRAEVYGV